MKGRNRIPNEHLSRLMEAAASVIERHNPPTMGPCHYCEYHITHGWFGPCDDLQLTCDLCRHLLTGHHRIFEYEEPLSAI